jgi:5-methylcytosine-specific restriction endonuclease McrA
MKHKRISKKTRELVLNKYGGKCAYCGCDLTLSTMQVDHIKAVYASSLENDGVETQDDSLENLNPSCRQCNFYKGTLDIEQFRYKIKTTLYGTCQNTFQAKLAKKLGMMKVTQFDKFYFEKL